MLFPRKTTRKQFFDFRTRKLWVIIGQPCNTIMCHPCACIILMTDDAAGMPTRTRANYRASSWHWFWHVWTMAWWHRHGYVCCLSNMIRIILFVKNLWGLYILGDDESDGEKSICDMWKHIWEKERWEKKFPVTLKLIYLSLLQNLLHPQLLSTA